MLSTHLKPAQRAKAREQLLETLARFPPLPVGHPSRKRLRGVDQTATRNARFPVLRLLCFRQPWRSHQAYNPPVASINFRSLLSLARPQEFVFSDLEQSILNSGYI